MKSDTNITFSGCCLLHKNRGKETFFSSLYVEARVNVAAYYVLHLAHDDPEDMDEDAAVSIPSA